MLYGFERLETHLKKSPQILQSLGVKCSRGLVQVRAGPVLLVVLQVLGNDSEDLARQTQPLLHTEKE